MTCAWYTFINKCLGRHWYDLEFDDQTIDQIQHEMIQEEQKINGSDRHINFSKLSLHRVFNDPAFQTDGRFYGGWRQEIPKRFRSRIVINGKRTVEYDYSNLHPTMLYLLEGLEPPSDSYVDVVPDLKGWQCPNEDNMRKAVKLCFNAMVNAPKQMTRGPKEFRRSNCNCKWSELTAAIVKRHQPIAKYFYSGAGIKLQRLDSDIAEMVMMHFANMNYPVLPIHDSFILHHSLESELQEMMERAFNRVIGGQVGVDKKKVEAFSNSPETSLFWENNTIKEQNDSEECLDYDVQELIESMNVGHHVRLTAFRALKY